MADDSAERLAPPPFPWETIMWILVECVSSSHGIAPVLEAMRNAEVAWNVMRRNGVEPDVALECAGQIALDFLGPEFADRWSPWSPSVAVT